MTDKTPFFTVEVDSFTKALVGVTAVVQSRNTVLILSNILITEQSGTVRLTATDLDMQVRLPLAPVEFNRDVPLQTTVNGKNLLSVFQNLPKGAQARLELNEKRQMIVTSGSARFKLPTLPIDDFPLLEMVSDGSARMVFEPAQLHAIFHRHAFAVSTEETRYYLNGINMHPSKEADSGTVQGVCFAATDGHNLAHQVLMDDDIPDDLPNVIIPTAAVNLVEKLCGDLDEDAGVSVNVSASKIEFHLGDWHIISKTIDGQFPDYTRVIPEANPIKVVLDRAAMSALAKRVQVLSSEKTRAIKCEFSKGKLMMMVTSPKNGEARGEMPCSFEGDSDLTLGVNGGYLLKQLAVHTGDNISLHLADPTAPIRLENMDLEGQYLTVLMPMRV